MPIYYDSHGRKINLTTELGRGGEGSVYAVAGDDHSVGKIYHEPISAEKAEKLLWMVGNQSQQLLKVAAWTTQTLYDRPSGGKMIGFLMPAVRAKEIHELYSPKSRRTHFPDADWRFLIRAAQNIARAFNSVHEAGHVIGDVNHGNCAVLPDGTVKLIDCDSYSIHAAGRYYPCEVGISTHIPPELQGQSLRGVIRRQEHDNFGLAVIIFQLLFLGRHPFSGRPLGKEEKSLDDCIREYRFAYGSGAAARRIQPPPGVPPLDCVSKPVAELFERAFLTRDARPTSREWIEGLECLARDLKTCPQNSGHHYLKNFAQCPWCEVEQQTGNAVFPVNHRPPGAASGFNVTTVEQLLNSIRMPAALPPEPPRQIITAPPDPALASERKSNLFFVMLIVSQIILLVGLIALVNILGSLIAGFAFAVVAYRSLIRFDPQIKKEIASKLLVARQGWTQLAGEWKLRESNQTLTDDMNAVRKQIAEYKNLSQLRQQKLYRLERDIHTQQLDDYLDGYRIAAANISGIGWNRAITLQSYGIETAADISSNRILAIPGFGPAYTQKLIIWRDNIKSRFRFDPRKGVSPAEKQKVENEIANLRRQLESALQNGVTRLRVKAANAQSKNHYLVSRAGELSETLAQAESNNNVFNRPILQAVLLFAVAIGIPFGGGVVQIALTPRAAVTAGNSIPSPSPTIPNNTNSVLSIDNGNLVAINGNTADANLIANQNKDILEEIAAIDINSLTDFERQTKAKEYYERGVGFTKTKNFAQAEKYYRAAIKFDERPADYHHELGYALYRLKKNSQAVDAFQKAISQGSTNPDTQELLGLSYLNLKKWREAQEIFDDLTRVKYDSFPTYYNLGIAAQNAGDLEAAALALQRAVQIKPGEAKAHLELGRCFIKLGRLSDAKEEYRILSTQNPQLAAQLNLEIIH